MQKHPDAARLVCLVQRFSAVGQLSEQQLVLHRFQHVSLNQHSVSELCMPGCNGIRWDTAADATHCWTGIVLGRHSFNMQHSTRRHLDMAETCGTRLSTKIVTCPQTCDKTGFDMTDPAHDPTHKFRYLFVGFVC